MSEALHKLPVVSSLVVQVLPDSLSAVENFVKSKINAEIHANDRFSKLVVVIEVKDDAALSDFMSELGALQGVITVNMVFHHTDSSSSPEPQYSEKIQSEVVENA